MRAQQYSVRILASFHALDIRDKAEAVLRTGFFF